MASRNFSRCRRSSSVAEVHRQRKVSRLRQERGKPVFSWPISAFRRRLMIFLQCWQRFDGGRFTASWRFGLSLPKLRICLWIVSCSKTRCLSWTSAHILRRCSGRILLRWISEWDLYSLPLGNVCTSELHARIIGEQSLSGTVHGRSHRHLFVGCKVRLLLGAAPVKLDCSIQITNLCYSCGPHVNRNFKDQGKLRSSCATIPQTFPRGKLTESIISEREVPDGKCLGFGFT